jgi:serine/threonine protein kinase
MTSRRVIFENLIKEHGSENAGGGVGGVRARKMSKEEVNADDDDEVEVGQYTYHLHEFLPQPDEVDRLETAKIKGETVIISDPGCPVHVFKEFVEKAIHKKGTDEYVFPRLNDKENELGVGSHGAVYDLKNGYVVKKRTATVGEYETEHKKDVVVQVDDVVQGLLEELGREMYMESKCEIETLLVLRGTPHVVQIQGYSEDFKYLILPKYDGDLNHFKKRLFKSSELRQKYLSEIEIQLYHGLNEIWQAGYIHSDLKPGNILYSIHEDGSIEVVMSDFAKARLLTVEKFKHGTCAYMDPDFLYQSLLEGYKVDEPQALDVWCVGVTLLELEVKAKEPIFSPGFRVESDWVKLLNEDVITSQMFDSNQETIWSTTILHLLNKAFKQEFEFKPLGADATTLSATVKTYARSRDRIAKEPDFQGALEKWVKMEMVGKVKQLQEFARRHPYYFIRDRKERLNKYLARFKL